jgi:heterodisulfide reductase subunit C
MENYHDLLMQDIRFEEGLKACMNCGVCTAICPAAEFYDYDPRKIVDTVQTGDNHEIETLLKSETIWYCGECMSCKTRCPRGNTPALVIMSLRTLSQKLGFFTESEKGRQQFAIKRSVGENIFKYGYCVATYAVSPEMHAEQGPIWKYILENPRDIYERLGGQNCLTILRNIRKGKQPRWDFNSMTRASTMSTSLKFIPQTTRRTQPLKD